MLSAAAGPEAVFSAAEVHEVMLSAAAGQEITLS